MNLFNNFREVTAAQEKKSFTFFPDELITTPEEFASALSKYAQDEGRDLVITKLSMSPDFTLNGVAYNATRLTNFCGSFVVVKAMKPEQVEALNVSPQRRRWMAMVWKYVIPTCFWVALIWLTFARAFI